MARCDGIQRPISIPEPVNKVDSLWRTAQALKEAVEVIQGIRGNREYALKCELQDLEDLVSKLERNLMGTSPSDFLIEVEKGNIPKHRIVHKFGENNAVPNGSWELVANLSEPTVFKSAAAAVRIKAGDAADDASGAGAREITIEGIDSNLARVTEAVATAGASASTDTSTLFWRQDRAWVSACGTYATPRNTGIVNIEPAGGGTDLLRISATEGQTQHAMYSLADGETGYVLHAYVSGSGKETANCRMFHRGDINVTAAPVKSQRLIHAWSGVLERQEYNPRGSNRFGGLSGPRDIWMEAYGDGAVTKVTAGFSLLIVQD